MKEKVIRGYIYKITNLKNGLCYIGKTTYKDVNRRFKQHIHYALDLQKGSETTVHQAMRDYGIENFIIEIVDTVYSPNFLEDVEKFYIQKYHTWIKDPLCKGYNQSQGGEGTHYSGKEFSEYLADKILTTYQELKNQEEVARRLSINVTTVRNYLIMNGIQRDDAKTIAIRETGRKVAILKDNQIIAIYPSLGEAARHFQEKEYPGHISEVCYGKRPDVKGYTAKFTDEKIFNENYILPTIKIQKSNSKKSIVMLDKDTLEELKVFESGCEAGRYFEINRPANATTCIKRAIERDGTWRGYKWKYN